MPTITALKVQTRNKDRVNVYLDGEFAFGLAKIEAIRLRLGQSLTAEDIARLRQAATFEWAYETALKFLSYRPRSEAEVRQYFNKKERKKKKEAEQKGEDDSRALDESVVGAVIERLRRAGLVNDAGFAQFWVENRTAFRPKGKRALQAEMRAKGLPTSAIEAALVNADDTAVAGQLAAARARRLKDLPEPEFRRKLSDYLARRGIGYDVIAEAVERAWRERGGEDGLSSPSEAAG